MSKLWGARFEAGTDKLADQFSFSIEYDHKLAKFDVIGSVVHASMLGKCNIIPKSDVKKIIKGLMDILDSIEKGSFRYDPKAEDIHTDIQQKLKKAVGPAADKLHTARSRNDLIVLDMKLYCLTETAFVVDKLAKLQKAIIKCAEAHHDVIMPAYTHLQSAQVVLLSHHLLAYVEMLERDKSRLLDAMERMDIMPAGCCALSGTSLPIDRDYVAEELGFQSVTRNSIYAVSDRDFIIEILGALAITGMHFSRIAEDFIIWATSEFGFVSIDWSLCTGSSIMPHKKNPDILELTRGETANLYANLNKLLVIMKALPLTYNRDLQLDKPPLFDSMEKVQLMAQLLKQLFETLKINRNVLEASINKEAFFSVDVMEYLIKKEVSYREAHDTVGRMFKECVDKGKKISDLSEKELKKFHSKLDGDIKKMLNPRTSVSNKKSFGSTNPKMVGQQIKEWKKALNV
jgi:argininosuccinate lyase